MLMVCHHLNPQVPEDVAFAESRIRPETIAAEDVLHDLGVLSMISSDSQAMGRAGEVVTRTWQTAHKMKVQRGPLPEDGARSDNFRVKYEDADLKWKDGVPIDRTLRWPEVFREVRVLPGDALLNMLVASLP